MDMPMIINTLKVLSSMIKQGIGNINDVFVISLEYYEYFTHVTSEYDKNAIMHKIYTLFTTVRFH